MGIGIFFLILGVAMGLGGLAYHSRGNARYLAATTHWLRTEATILSARVDARQKMVNDTMTTDYVPTATYSYTAHGATLQGQKVALCGKDWKRQDAEAWAAAHAPGTAHPVWCDPARPEDSALLLNPPSRAAAILLTLLGLGVALFGIAMIAKWHH